MFGVEKYRPYTEICKSDIKIKFIDCSRTCSQILLRNMFRDHLATLKSAKSQKVTFAVHIIFDINFFDIYCYCKFHFNICFFQGETNVLREI